MAVIAVATMVKNAIAVATMVKNAIANVVVIVVQMTMMVQKKNALVVAVLSTHLM